MSIGMSDEFQSFDQRAIIKVCGIGGGGGNAVDRMIESKLADVEFIVINTDAQVLKKSKAGVRMQIGASLTSGLGSGAKPEIGHKAADSDRERIADVIKGADMVFLTVGLGGGTGTGASPVVAAEAAKAGALTVAIVTLPFSFEGPERMKNALKGLAELEQHVDTLIVVPNDRVAELSKQDMGFLQAFQMADEVLHNGVRAISELITVTGLINLDFADVRTIMQARGRALMGIGIAEGPDRAKRAAEEAIICPLLEQSNINGATGVIINIKGGCDIGMREVQEAVTIVKQSASPDANIIFGAVVDEQQRPELQVTVIAAGFPKGVSEKIVMSDNVAATILSQRPATAPPPPPIPPKPASVAMPSPAPAPAQVAAPPEPPVAVAVKPAAVPPPLRPVPPVPAVPPKKQEEMVFPVEEEEVSEEWPRPGIEPEPEEDMHIPAFLRKRMKNRMGK